MLDAIVEPLTTAIPFIKSMANGEDTGMIENNFKGQYGELIDNLNLVRESIDTLLNESDKLTEAAEDGQLSYRANTRRLKGSYAKIIEGINETLDSLLKPLNIASRYMEQIGNGEIPVKITEEYRGDFEHIKNSINACIEGLGALTEGSNVMYKMSRNDYSVSMEGTYLGIYNEIKKSTNLINERMRTVINILIHVTVGDLSDLQSIIEEGKRSEKDALIPALIAMIESITFLVEETETINKRSRIEIQRTVCKGYYRNQRNLRCNYCSYRRGLYSAPGSCERKLADIYEWRLLR